MDPIHPYCLFFAFILFATASGHFTVIANATTGRFEPTPATAGPYDFDIFWSNLDGENVVEVEGPTSNVSVENGIDSGAPDQEFFISSFKYYEEGTYYFKSNYSNIRGEIIVNRTGISDTPDTPELIDPRWVGTCGDWETINPDFDGSTMEVDITVYRGATAVNMSIDLLANGTDPMGMAMYMTHAHINPCNDSYGGPHYRQDIYVQQAVPANEIWLMFMSMMGMGENTTARSFSARQDEVRSFVLHNHMTGAKIGCCNLQWESANADTGADTDGDESNPSIAQKLGSWWF